MLYRNLGAPWRMSTGQVVPRDGTFVPTPRDMDRMERRRLLGIRFVPVPAEEEKGASVPTAAPSAAPAGIEDSVAPTGPADAPPSAPPAPAPWPLRMTPTKYLQLHPEGQHADLARAHVAAQGGTDDDATDD